jgi:MFS family permease
MRQAGRALARIALAALVVAATVLASHDFFTLLAVSISCSVGAFLIDRRARNSVGWLVLAIGLTNLGTTTPPGLDFEALAAGNAPWPQFLWVWISAGTGGLAFVCYMAVAFVFPSGSLVQPRRRLIRLVLILAALASFLPPTLSPSIAITAPDGTGLSIPNLLSPFGADGAATIPDLGAGFGTAIPILLLVWASVDLLRRYRRAVGIERLQMRWFLTAVIFLVSSISFGIALYVFVGPQLGVIGWLPALFAYPTVALAIGVAILRYRLYDIDRIVSRTLSWGLVTGTILAIFAGLVIGLQASLAKIMDTGTIAVAISTLVAAALFQPIRRRIQQAVDRRFDRARYDGQRTAAAFADRLRIGVDLDALVDDLTATADEAVRPTAASLWLLQASGRSGDRP